MGEHSLWGLILAAGGLVQIILAMLLCLSVASWTVILQRRAAFKQLAMAQEEAEQSLKRHGMQYFAYLKKKEVQGPFEGIAYAGLSVFQARQHASEAQRLSDVERALKGAIAFEVPKVEQNLGFLATLSSISPYIGLFGTVWGIMNAFHALSDNSQATLNLVAPGIAEALIATAMGLFVAIPAGLAFNRFAHRADAVERAFEAWTLKLYWLFQSMAEQSPAPR